MSMGGHQSSVMLSDEWLTPPRIIAALGGPEAFDLDPCAAPEPRPWPTARRHIIRAEDGLAQPWAGTVWLNPPYGRKSTIGPWMRRLVEHGDGIALIFARTETEVFFETVWRAADAVLFLEGRLFFFRPDGTEAEHNGGAPSVLCAYGPRAAALLGGCGIRGALLYLKRPT